MSSKVLEEGALLGIGNPLLDISANVDDTILNKYELKRDDAIMAEEKHMPLYKELTDNHDVLYLAGGSVQNSLRVAQWILKRPRLTTYFGCVGKDEYADVLRQQATKDGVNVQYQVCETAATGTCAVLVTGTHRSLCANLAAAQRFTIDHLGGAESRRWIEVAKIIYVSGFFVAVSPESILQLAEHARSRGLAFVMNLSAPFVSQFYKDALEKILPYVDVLFGNETEAVGFAEAFNLNETEIPKIAEKIVDMPKLNAARRRVVCITQGSQPVVLVEAGRTTLIPVHPVAREAIVDTNGAGDAFSGGFLAQMVLGNPYKTCVDCGIYAATYIVQHSGCSFSTDCDFCPCVL